MNYYISDLHFGQSNISKLEGRPFETSDEMDKTIIENWNSRVSDDDTVYILGDFVWSPDMWDYYLERLSGKKVLILGNHDPENFSEDIRKHFLEIVEYKEITDVGRRVIMCHYPIPFHKHDYDENVWMLYGHVHHTREYDFLVKLREELKATRTNPYRAYGNFVNVGCMMPWMDYTPRTLEEIIENNI